MYPEMKLLKSMNMDLRMSMPLQKVFIWTFG